MILDALENIDRYLSMNRGFEKAAKFLQHSELNQHAMGKHEIDGDRVFAIVENTVGRDKKDAQLEAHEQYIDIQLVLKGIDNMGWKPTSACKQISQAYNLNADIKFFADEPEIFLPVSAGMFAIFFPNDAHMPLISSEHLHKVVVKIKLVQ